VEVADFNSDQIADFARKWFQQQKDPIKAREFPKELRAFPGLQELATNPLLLTLLCLVFEEVGQFPANRSELYKEGVDVLLKRWDVRRNIQREEIYKQLSLQKKEDLLSQIAYKAFEKNDYFFKQEFVEEKIQAYIRNLPSASSETKALQLDSEAVLNSIAAHHGLLVERARRVYSFSHLTFQEFFTARYFKEKADKDFDDLLCHITDQRWREVFLLTVGMLQSADGLLQGMKQKIDGLLAHDQDFQRFLDLGEKKSCSTKKHYKPAAIRAHYFDLARDVFLDLELARDLDQDLARILASDFDIINARARALDLTLDLSLVLALSLARARTHPHDLSRDLSLALNRVLARTIESIDLDQPIRQLRDQLPGFASENHDNWWQENGQKWSKKLRDITIQYRNIGHHWQFSDDQLKLLQQYYEANKFLVDCLKSDCYVSREVREEIELTLLLPFKQ
jgi:predicted NACHT family NTPase